MLLDGSSMACHAWATQVPESLLTHTVCPSCM
jgi:hypothetical protein